MGLFSKLSFVSRKRKLQLFYEIMKPSSETRVLDVGAQANPYGNRGLQLIDSYPWRDKLTVVNTSREHLQLIKQHYPEVEVVVGDACALPWPDRYFDIIYSNAVIEHLGDFERQKEMASEIARVAKRWFVTTPNRWYPFEFHLRLPFVTWLPGHGYLWASKLLSYDHARQAYAVGLDYSDLRLMTAKELERCFPGSRIIKQRVTFMPETLIAVGGDIFD